MRKTLAGLALVMCLSLAANAQAPSINGRWKLNLDKSLLGPEHPHNGYQLEWTIEQADSTVHITESAVHVSRINIPLPDYTRTLTYIVDGQEREMRAGGGFSLALVSATWQVGTLAIREINNTTGQSFRTSRCIYVAKDGSELIEQITTQSSNSDVEQRLVFEREP